MTIYVIVQHNSVFGRCKGSFILRRIHTNLKRSVESSYCSKLSFFFTIHHSLQPFAAAYVRCKDTLCMRSDKRPSDSFQSTSLGKTNSKSDRFGQIIAFVFSYNCFSRIITLQACPVRFSSSAAR